MSRPAYLDLPGFAPSKPKPYTFDQVHSALYRLGLDSDEVAEVLDVAEGSRPYTVWAADHYEQAVAAVEAMIAEEAADAEDERDEVLVAELLNERRVA